MWPSRAFAADAMHRIRAGLRPRIQALAGAADFDWIPEDANLPENVEFGKKLRALEKEVALSGLKLRPRDRSLFKRVVRCSSMDEPTQGPENMMRVDGEKFWSSAGSANESMSEFVVLELETPLSVVRGIQFSCFRAYFQLGFPIFPPVALAVSIGMHPSQLRHVVTRSVAATDHVQGFLFPTWEIGRYIRLDFLGARQKQLHDSQYYIVMRHVSAVGLTLDPAETIRRLSMAMYPASGCEHVEHMADAEFFMSLFHRKWDS